MTSLIVALIIVSLLLVLAISWIVRLQGRVYRLRWLNWCLLRRCLRPRVRFSVLSVRQRSS